MFLILSVGNLFEKNFQRQSNWQLGWVGLIINKGSNCVGITISQVTAVNLIIRLPDLFSWKYCVLVVLCLSSFFKGISEYLCIQA